VAIALNIGQILAIQYYTEYLKLVGFEDITKIYLEFKGDTSYFVSLCKEAKASKMKVQDVINLLKIANNSLPSVQHRYEELQKQNSILDSNLNTAAKEFQNLSNQISYMNNRRDEIKSECENEKARLQDLRQQTAKLESFMYNYKNYNEEYTNSIKTIENKVQDILSDKKAFLKLAIFSLIHSMRSNPDKYTSLVYHNNDNQNSSSSSSRDNSNHKYLLEMSSKLPPPPYDTYVIEDYKAIVLGEAEKLYNTIVDQLVCEVINEDVTKQSIATASTPELPLQDAIGGEVHSTLKNVIKSQSTEEAEAAK
jgi:cell division septum initiation protein DivIVA